MNVVHLLGLMLFSNCLCHTSANFFENIRLCKGLCKPLLGSSRSDLASKSDRIKPFDVQQLDNLTPHKRGRSWLDDNLVFRNDLTKDEFAWGLTTYSKWLSNWSNNQLKYVRMPYKFKDIPFLNKLVKAHAAIPWYKADSEQKEKLEAAIRVAGEKILSIAPTNFKATDVLAEGIGVLSRITASSKAENQLSAGEKLSRQYLFENQLLERIVDHLHKHNKLQTLASDLKDLLEGKSPMMTNALKQMVKWKPPSLGYMNGQNKLYKEALKPASRYRFLRRILEVTKRERKLNSLG